MNTGPRAFFSAILGDTVDAPRQAIAGIVTAPAIGCALLALRCWSLWPTVLKGWGLWIW